MNKQLIKRPMTEKHQEMPSSSSNLEQIIETGEQVLQHTHIQELLSRCFKDSIPN